METFDVCLRLHYKRARLIYLTCPDLLATYEIATPTGPPLVVPRSLLHSYKREGARNHQGGLKTLKVLKATCRSLELLGVGEIPIVKCMCRVCPW